VGFMLGNYFFLSKIKLDISLTPNQIA